MYEIYNGLLTITVNDWLDAGLTMDQYKHDSKGGDLEIVRRGINGNTRIDVRSIRRPERMRAIERRFGCIDKKENSSIYKVEIDTKARDYFISYRTPSGDTLEPDEVQFFVNKASLLNTLIFALDSQRSMRAKYGKSVKMCEFYSDGLKWFHTMIEQYPCRFDINNVRNFERLFKQYCNDGYSALVHGNQGNDAARRVSAKMERLILALWRTHDKPFANRVYELYCEFVSGKRELYDQNSGECFRPSDFSYKGRALEISESTIRNYLKAVVNYTAVFSDRNGNFEYVNQMRPKHKRKLGQYSLSKISMDDVAMSRKSTRGWIYKYIAVDVVSGYYFRPAYVVGKPTKDTVMRAFRNMFCELQERGLKIPGELEVEHHLMADIDWLPSAFPFVRFCSSPTEKRAEHKIKALKYSTAKDNGHTRGRWYAKHEAFRSVRNKVNGDYIDPVCQPQTIVADDLADIEEYNNSLHPLQKRFPGMTRRQVLISEANPKLQNIEPYYLYKYIGNKTDTSIYNNNFCPVDNDEFELVDFESLKRLSVNNWSVSAYWLPDRDGSISKVYLYQGDNYIGEAVNSSQFAYNECAFERTEEDTVNILHQQKRVAKFDKFIKDHKSEIPKIGMMQKEISEKINNVECEIIEHPQPVGYEEDDGQYDMAIKEDWVAMAIDRL